jgi:hypothetical protein
VAPGEGALSARTVLEVADGLRWSDPRLGLSLAEHALRLAGDDAGARAAAQRSVIRSLAEVDRFEEVVSRATPLLEEAAVRQDRDDLAGLLVELAAAAIGFGDDAVATRLVAPVGSGEELPGRTTVHAALLRAQLAGATGDVAGADRAAREAEAALRGTAEPEAGLVRRDLARARASARSRSGDPASALALVSAVVSTDPGADADGGRRSLLAAADQVGLLIDLGRPEEALERGRAALPTTTAPPLVRPAARVRLALAERIHLAHGAPDEARSLARTAAEQLEDAGHDADAARAWEVVAAAAERGGDLAAALSAVRHGHTLETRARDRRDPTLRVLATLASSAPELPARPASPPPEPGRPEPDPALSSDVASLPAGERSSVRPETAGDVDGSASPVRRRAHRRQDARDAARPSGTESVPETLARLLGTHGAVPVPGAGTVSAKPGEGAEADPLGVAGRDDDGVSEEAASPAPLRRPRSGATEGDELSERSDVEESDTDPRPTSDAFSTAPGRRSTDPAAAGRLGAGAEPPSPESVASATGGSAVPPWDPDEFPHIDPADPLGSGTGRETSGRTLDDASLTGRDTSAGEEPVRGVGPTSPEPRSSDREVPTTRGGDARPEAIPRGAVPGRPLSRQDEQDAPGPERPPTPPSLGLPPASRYEPGGAARDELDEELALTLAGLLAEYGSADQPSTPPRDGLRPDVAVPSARRHVSGSMPLPPTDQRFAARPAEPPGRAASAPGDGAVGGRAPRGENGARLADLLAEAMDAFRHTGPEESSWGPADPARGHGEPARTNGDPVRGNGVPARGHGEPARTNGDRERNDPGRARADGTREPGIGTRRG